MKRFSRLTVAGLTATLLAASGAAPITPAVATTRHHAHAQRNLAGAAAAGEGVADAARGGGVARGLYAGAGGIFSPGYQVPDPGTIRIGSQLLGGDFGKAYEDYYRHYYYYKYAYCPIGTGYVIYSRLCVGIGNLFQ